jgi:riboflavin-specific deaminase-like protein
MAQPIGASAPRARTETARPELAWRLVLAAACHAERAERAGVAARFAIDEADALVAVREHDQAAVLEWRPVHGWSCLLPHTDERRALVDLYLPVCGATAAHPVTVGHLGESLDGFIATHAGESQWVTGPENVLHMHRLRALCDAVIVGAGTVAADNPQLTTRLVPGPNPLRVVLDPARRLSDHHRVFADDGSETLYVCARDLIRAGEERFGRASIVGVPGTPDKLDLAELMRHLRARGHARVFVEGGGVTVSMFLQENLLDRLHLAVAPLLIGDGRAAIRLPAPAALGDCHRPRYRVFRMGGDVLFDCDLRTRHDERADVESSGPAVTRII